MKRFTIPCLFGEKKHPVHFYLGDLPLPGKQPFTFQGEWFAKRRQAKIPQDIVASFMKLAVIAKENKTSFEDLAVEALGASSTPETPSKKAKKPLSLSRTLPWRIKSSAWFLKSWTSLIKINVLIHH